MPPERGDPMRRGNAREFSLLVFIVVLAAILTVFAPRFFSSQNLVDILVNMSYLAIASLGMLFVILTGQIDISVGAILGVCSTLAAVTAKAGQPILVVFLVSIVAGAILGGFNGLVSTQFRIHSIIVTLGTLYAYRGALILVTQGRWIYNVPASFNQVGLGHILGVPNPIWAMAIVLVVGTVVLRYTTWGRALYAIGSNTEAARLAGIPVRWVLLGAFAANGALVGLATMFFATRFSAIQSTTGSGFEFVVITAVLVGGANIFGGTGRLLGVAMGALLLGLADSAFVFLKISSYWVQAFQGFVILLAVSLDNLSFRRRRATSAERSRALMGGEA